MLREQDAARATFEDYVRKSGIKVNHIARQIGCHPTNLYHWRAGSRDLAGPILLKLVGYLVDRKSRL